MFQCNSCKEKEKLIEYLKEQNTTLLDRIMAYSQESFLRFEASKQPKTILYPQGVDEQGKLFDYKDSEPDEATEEQERAFGLNQGTINIEEKV